MIDPRSALGRLVPGLGFLAWLIGLLWLLVGGRYTDFLAPGLWGLLLLAILGMGAFALARFLRPAGHAHGSGSSAFAVKMVLMLLPLAFIFAIPSPQAGSYTFDNRSGMGSGRWQVDFPPDVAGDPAPTTAPDSARPAVPAPAIDATLLEIYNSSSSLVGRRVVTIGMVNPRDGLGEGTIVVFRFTLVCCAADARPVWIVVTGKEAKTFKRDTWVRVEGTLGACAVNGQLTPWLKADRIEPIHRPYDAYLN